MGFEVGALLSELYYLSSEFCVCDCEFGFLGFLENKVLYYIKRKEGKVCFGIYINMN